MDERANLESEMVSRKYEIVCLRNVFLSAA